MSTTNIGNPIQGRRLKNGNNGQDPIEIKASIGDGTTASSATPFFKFTGTEISSVSNGQCNVTAHNVPSGYHKAVLVEVNGTQYWMPVYALS